MLPAGVSWASDAGEVSGVVTVRVDGALDEATARDTLLQTAGILATHLRSSAPALEIQAGWGRGTDYLAAYPDIRRRTMESGPLMNLPPAPVDLIVAEQCDECRESAAQLTVRIVGEDRRLCVDCASRAAAAGAGGAGERERLPKAQELLWAAVESLLPDTTLAPPPLDFQELAELAGYLNQGRRGQPAGVDRRGR